MNSAVLIAIITSLGGGLIGLVGIWLGRKPVPERRRRKDDPTLTKERKLFEAEREAFRQSILAELNGRIAALQHERDETNTRVAALSTRLAACERENSELREENLQLRARIRHLEGLTG